MLCEFTCFCFVWTFFSKIINVFKTISFKNTITVSNICDQVQARSLVGPDLGPKLFKLQRLSADDISRRRVNRKMSLFGLYFSVLSLMEALYMLYVLINNSSHVETFNGLKQHKAGDKVSSSRAQHTKKNLSSRSSDPSIKVDNQPLFLAKKMTTHF